MIADGMWSAVELRVGTDDLEEMIDFADEREFKKEQSRVLDWMGEVITRIRAEIKH